MIVFFPSFLLMVDMNIIKCLLYSSRYGMMHTLTFRKESFSRKDINGRFDLLTDEENTIDVEFGGCQDTGWHAVFLRPISCFGI